MSTMKNLCTGKEGEAVVIQGNIAFAAGCVRSGIHAADGYPGTPSTEVIDKGLSAVQDMIAVGWSVNEAVAASMGHGVSLAGKDCVVTMKIPGLFQAADNIGSSAFFTGERGALVYYIASDFTPSSTQHLIDPRPFLKSCFIPVLEPRTHQELHEAPELAADLSRALKTPVVILACGTLCHSEGLVRLNPIRKREAVTTGDLKSFCTLPNIARANYNRVLSERLPALKSLVETSPLNKWEKGAGKLGVITYGATEMFVREVKNSLGEDIDILSIGFTWPLPEKLLRDFHTSIKGDVYVIEDGFRYLQEEMERLGLPVKGKEADSNLTEWDPALVAKRLGYAIQSAAPAEAKPLGRPPMICPGCPYRLFGDTVRNMKKKGKIEACFGDIGCNTLLFFMNAVDTTVAMGASEANRAGFVLANPEKAAKCLSILGDGTECHSGMDATRSSIARHIPGVKVILDNNWIAMTGGQPGPTSPVNLAGQASSFNLKASLEAHGAKVMEVSGYDRKGIRKTLTDAFKAAEEGDFTTVIVTGTCIRKVDKKLHGVRLEIDADKCKRCGTCQICPGIQADDEKFPSFNNLCSGCAGQSPACAQMCPVGAMKLLDQVTCPATGCVDLPAAPENIPDVDLAGLNLPEKLAVAIRGVGGQGNLFFGRVLTQLAFLAGYGDTNVVKGETHGMAQMGGPVISTFSCGKVCSPVLLPGTADCLVSMEMSEVLRPGFLDMLKPGGTLLLAETMVLPHGTAQDVYPSAEQIGALLSGYKTIRVNVLDQALKLGDPTGRVANVVMIGALSSLAPFDAIPVELWLKALKSVSPKPAVWTANHAAFLAGRKLL